MISVLIIKSIRLRSFSSCLADQRARHHHGRRAGVCHPAQHDGEAAVWPGKSVKLNPVISAEESHFVRHSERETTPDACERRSSSQLVLAAVWSCGAVFFVWSGSGGETVRECCCGRVRMCARDVKGRLSALCRCFVRLTWRDQRAEVVQPLDCCFPRRNRDGEVREVKVVGFIRDFQRQIQKVCLQNEKKMSELTELNYLFVVIKDTADQAR